MPQKEWYVVCIRYQAPMGFGEFNDTKKTYHEIFAESAEDAAVKMKGLYSTHHDVLVEFVFGASPLTPNS